MYKTSKEKIRGDWNIPSSAIKKDFRKLLSMGFSPKILSPSNLRVFISDQEVFCPEFIDETVVDELKWRRAVNNNNITFKGDSSILEELLSKQLRIWGDVND